MIRSSWSLLRMQRTARQLIFRKYDLPSCIGELNQGVLNYAIITRSERALGHKFGTFQKGQPLVKGAFCRSFSSFSNESLEVCLSLSAYYKLKLNHAGISGWSFRCYFRRSSHQLSLHIPQTIGTYIEAGKPEGAWPKTDGGSHDIQSSEERGRRDASLLTPCSIGTYIEAQKGEGGLVTNNCDLDDLKSAENRGRIDAANDVLIDGVKQEVNQNMIRLSHPFADSEVAIAMCFILEKNGWGPNTREQLQQFVGKITPDLVTTVVKQQKNAKVALSFLEWAGEQEGYEHRAEAFTKVVGRLGKDRDFATAWQVLDGMQRQGIEVNYAFSILIHRLKRANMVDELAKAMDRMKHLNVIPTVPLYTSALQLLLKANSLGVAQKLYQQMLQDGLSPDKKLYEVLISGFARAGKLDDALSFFKEMEKRGHTPNTFIYTILIRCFYIAGKFDEGHKLHKEMMKNDCMPKVFTQCELACALHGENTMDQIDKFLEGAEMKGHILSVHTYNNLLQFLLDTGKFREAVEFFHRIPGKVHKGDECSQKEDAECSASLESYTILISGLCKAGKMLEALKFFEEMLARGPKPSEDICSCLLLSLSNAGMMDEALGFFDHILQLKVPVSDDAQKGFFCAVRASGHLYKAFKLFEAMKRKGSIDQDSDFLSVVGLENK